MKRIVLSFALLFVSALIHSAEVRCIEPSAGSSRCVSVSGASLAHTAQAMAREGSLSEQIKTTLANLDKALKSGGSSLAQAVKVNVYVTRDSATAEVEAGLAGAFTGAHKPAVSFVTTALPWPTALVAMDAVGVSNAASESAAAESIGGRVGNACAVMPAGTRVYISGQAEKGDGTLADATRQTMASLGRTLEFLGLQRSDVIQVKSFLTPMARCADGETEIAAFFRGAKAPPCVFVDWKSALPIEIEMIVSASGNSSLGQGPSVEVRTPPGMTTPAVYSRLTIARHPATIYTGGLYPADSRASAESQLRSMFSNLKRTLDASGSDWMHLVKATYYVTDDELNKWHNAVRPDYFSPRRPPAASKAFVTGTGRAGQGITMDFIIVPGEP